MDLTNRLIEIARCGTLSEMIGVLERGASPYSAEEALREATKHGRLEMVKYLIANSHVNDYKAWS